MKVVLLATMNVLPFFFTVCSARVSAFVIVLSDSSCEKIGKREILKERKSGASVTKLPHY
jgi:hypothetical protein